MEDTKQRGKQMTARGKKVSFGNKADTREKALEVKRKLEKKRENKEKRQFFFDYNTVEQVLLSCAILVCLAGVMFESDRFQSTDSSGRLRYGWMRDLVTYAIITVVIGSLVYLVLVIMSEVVGYTPKCLLKMFRGKSDVLLQAADKIQEEQDNHVELQLMNPLQKRKDIRAGQDLLESEAKVKELENRMQEQANMMSQLAEARKKNVLAREYSKVKNNKSKVKAPGKGGKKSKKQFQPTRNNFQNAAAATTAADVADNPTRERRLSSRQLMEQVQQMKLEEESNESFSSATPVLGQKKLSFRRIKTEDGQEYFESLDQQGETTWTIPKGAEVVN
jgi:hypothetical protein